MYATCKHRYNEELKSCYYTTVYEDRIAGCVRHFIRVNICDDQSSNYVNRNNQLVYVKKSPDHLLALTTSLRKHVLHIL